MHQGLPCYAHAGLAGRKLRESWEEASERFIGLLETGPKFGKGFSEPFFPRVEPNRWP